MKKIDDEKISERFSEGISERFEKEFGRQGKEIAFTFNVIVANPKFTAKEIASKIGKTSRTVENHLQKLKDAGILEREGPKLGGIWKVKKEE